LKKAPAFRPGAKQEERDMPYVDGFVVPVPKDKIEAYKAMARKAGEIWKEYGALAFVECLADDVPYGQLTSFPRAVQAKEDETVAFSWIVYENRVHRDAINAKVMADSRLKDMKDMPFDGKRMIIGGFEAFLQL
jgi:uncharacterized protein YbaA (DUF1428 family)